MSIKTLLISALFVIFIFTPGEAFASIYYGGKVTTFPKWCHNFPGYYVEIDSALGGKENIIFGAGSKAYQFGPPVIVGQCLLGSGIPFKCDIDLGKGTNWKVGVLADSNPGIGTSFPGANCPFSGSRSRSGLFGRFLPSINFSTPTNTLLNGFQLVR